MNREEFEASLLHLWVTTRVPFTRANLQYATGATRKQIERWSDELVSSGVLDIDSDHDGELIFAVRGAQRPKNGTTSVADVVKVSRLEDEVKRASRALVAVPAAERALRAGDGKKSVLASTALSFFLGPIGWLYAAPLKEAIPASVVFVLLAKLLPMFIFGPLLGILLPLSAAAGGAYALVHNQSGGRGSIGKAVRGIKRAKD